MQKLKRVMLILKYLPLATWRYLKQDVRTRRGVLAVLGILVILVFVISASHIRAQRNDSINTPAQDAVETEIVTETEIETSPLVKDSPAPDPVQVTLTFAGDCTLGMDSSMGYTGSFNEMYERQTPEYFLQNVQAIFSEDDLTVVNFEGTLTDSEAQAEKTFTFKGEPAYTGVLTAGSVEVADLANNHSGDYGDQGFSDTIDALDAAGIAHFGYDEVSIIEIRGIKIGFTGLYTVYENPQHRVDLENNIQTLKDQGADLIVACFHWGLEMDKDPEPDQVELAHAAIDAGAHLVIGHHPHVVQGVEVYKGRYIAYSLGNFCFGGNYSPPDYDCMIFRQTFTVQGEAVLEDDDIQVIPCSISSVKSYNNYQPTPAEDTEKTRILEKLRQRSAGLGEVNIFENIS